MIVKLQWGVPGYDEAVAQITTIMAADGKSFIYEMRFTDWETGAVKITKSMRPFVVGDFVSEHQAHLAACKMVSHCGKVAAHFHTMRLRSVA